MAVVAAAVLALPAVGRAETYNLILTGANEPDASGNLGVGDPDGQAVGFVTLDPDTDMVNWEFDYANISGTAISGFHIHGPNATPTTNRPIFLGFPLSSTAVPNGTQSGMLMSDTVPTIGTLIDQINANPTGFYLNLHSSGTGGFPGGAVRAQLPEPGALGGLALGALALLRRRGRAA
jgi:hypothetical protein